MTEAKITTTEQDVNKVQTAQTDYEQIEVEGFTDLLTVEPHRVARVTVSRGETVEVEKFQFARVDVAVELPVLAEPNEVNDMIDIAMQISDGKVQAWYNETTGG